MDRSDWAGAVSAIDEGLKYSPSDPDMKEARRLRSLCADAAKLADLLEMPSEEEWHGKVAQLRDSVKSSAVPAIDALAYQADTRLESRTRVSETLRVTREIEERTRKMQAKLGDLDTLGQESADAVKLLATRLRRLQALLLIAVALAIVGPASLVFVDRYVVPHLQNTRAATVVLTPSVAGLANPTRTDAPPVIVPATATKLPPKTAVPTPSETPMPTATEAPSPTPSETPPPGATQPATWIVSNGTTLYADAAATTALLVFSSVWETPKGGEQQEQPQIKVLSEGPPGPADERVLVEFACRIFDQVLTIDAGQVISIELNGNLRSVDGPSPNDSSLTCLLAKTAVGITSEHFQPLEDPAPETYANSHTLIISGWVQRSQLTQQ
jgi:hypothetical protein